MKAKKSLVYDISNIIFRVAAMQKRSPYGGQAAADDLVGLCMHISLLSMLKWYNKFKPDFVVFAFEGRNNWRKEYTAKNEVRAAYKGNRVIDPEMIHFYNTIDSFKMTMKAHTSICCLIVDKMEADDSIAAYTQLYASPDHEITIVSGDKDFIQLLKLPNVKLVDPDSGKKRNQLGDKHYEPDLDYWLFLKCIRGDGGDNVRSAFPRVRETKVRAAYDDPYTRINFMNTTWSMPDLNDVSKEITYRVGDLYEENRILVSLYEQPADIRAELEAAVRDQVDNIGNYSHFHFLRFVEQHKLAKIRQEAMKFVELFANNQRFISGEKREIAQAKISKEDDVMVEDKPMTNSSFLEF